MEQCVDFPCMQHVHPGWFSRAGWSRRLSTKASGRSQPFHWLTLVAKSFPEEGSSCALPNGIII